MGDTPATRQPSRLTLANALSLARLLAAPLFAWAAATGRHGGALALFAFAVASDLADGPLARRRGESSAFGGFLDHLSDATFVSLGLGACALRGIVPAPLPVLVALAFAQYALDSRRSSERPGAAPGGPVLRASLLGRWNGVLYFVLLGVPVVRDGLGLGWPADAFVLVAGWLLVASTLLSMLGGVFLLLEKERILPSDMELEDEAEGVKLSCHDMGLIEKLRMTQFAGSCPEQIVIIGVEPAKVEWNTGLSGEIQEKIPEIIDAVMAEITCSRTR